MILAPSVKLREQLMSKQLTCDRLNGNILNGVQCNGAPTSQIAMKNSMLSDDIVRYADSVYERKVSSAHQTEEVIEAMKKLDAKFVAYLGGDVNEGKLSLDPLDNDSPITDFLDDMDTVQLKETQMEMFKKVSTIRLQMEALTLQPEGTKRMDLMQSEIRPIFTVECQLSQDLIKSVPRYDMFHVLQFESEKFQALTQCTRFGMEAQRAIKFIVDNDEIISNFGEIHFTLWWREPGTCLNEMLGMGILNIQELYDASLLEQCKRISINRRGVHLANLYMKISLLSSPYIIEKAIITAHNEVNNVRKCADENTNGKGSGSDKGAKPKSYSNNPASSVDNLKGLGNAATSHNQKNNNFQVEVSNFSIETSKVRLLKGFIYVNELRSVQGQDVKHLFMLCHRFWDEPTAFAYKNGGFGYQEQFALINDEKFLRRVRMQHLQINIAEYVTPSDSNANSSGSFHFIGYVPLMLHQFYIAYHDAVMANHLCKSKVPVIAIDDWVPIFSSDSPGTVIGEIKCFLAIGSDEQIINLMADREFMPSVVSQKRDVRQNAVLCHELPTEDRLVDMLRQYLILATCLPQSVIPMDNDLPYLGISGADTLFGSSQSNNMQTFKFILEIKRASDIPMNPSAKLKKGTKRNVIPGNSKRFPPNEPPTTYVTFQAEKATGNVYKSHEGTVYATKLVEKSTEPQWNDLFRVIASVDYLTDPRQRFVMKIWKKALSDKSHYRSEPTPLEDAIIGFTALDLSVFLKGATLRGWFDIVDYNGRLTGKLEVHCRPVENVRKRFKGRKTRTKINEPTSVNINADVERTPIDNVIKQFENSLDLTHLNLGQVIKHQFVELEEISHRLRSRLCDITGQQLTQEFDPEILNNWKPIEAEFELEKDDVEFNNFNRDINVAPDCSLLDEIYENKSESQCENFVIVEISESKAQEKE